MSFTFKEKDKIISKMMESGPWYECQGPNAAYVRKHQFQRLCTHYKITNEVDFPYHQRLLQNLLDIYIPDSMGNFGSYRGYGMFGLDIPIEKNITTAYTEYNQPYLQSMNILSEKLKPFLIHWLYKPGGKRYLLKAEENKEKMLS